MSYDTENEATLQELPDIEITNFSATTTEDEPEPFRVGRTRTVPVEEMYLPCTRIQLSENTGTIPDNSSEEVIPESI